jgi:hypothetical protein
VNKTKKLKVCPIIPLPGQVVLNLPFFPNIGRPRFTPGGNNLASKAQKYFLSQPGFRHDHKISLKDTGLNVQIKQVVIGNITSPHES